MYRTRVTSRALHKLLPFAAAVFLLLAPGLAHAGEDAAVQKIVQDTMSEDYPGSLGPAKKKLSDALALCLRKGCSGPVKAQVHVALGQVASQLGQGDDAKAQFASAIKLDSNAKLPSTGVTPNIRSQWDEAAKTAARRAPNCAARSPWIAPWIPRPWG